MDNQGDPNIPNPPESPEDKPIEQHTPTQPAQEPLYQPLHTDPTLPASSALNQPPVRKSRKKILIIISIATFVLIVIAAVLFFVLLKNSESDKSAGSKSGTQKSSLVASIKNKEDLEKLSEDEGAYKSFCKELITYDAEGPEVTSLHKRVGMSGGLNENLYLGCAVGLSGDEYVRNDISGNNDSSYRDDAKQDRDLAKTFTFDMYDTTYTAPGIEVTTRISSDIEREARNVYMAYSTLINGGYNPYKSEKVIQIHIFDKRDFSRYTSNCGPYLLTLSTAYLHNDDSCLATGASYNGQPIYFNEGTGATTYTVTIGNTRIVVEARNKQEAIAVIQGMKRTVPDNMDFLLKN